MSLDRAEVAGTGAAIAFHVVLIGALSLSLAHVAPPPEPPAMEVEMVDEVGLQPSAPAAVPAPPPPSQAPAQSQEITPPPPQPEPAPAPVVQPTPQPRVVPAPAPNSLAAQAAELRPTPPRPAPPRPAPPKPAPAAARPAPARPAQARPAPAKATPAKAAPAKPAPPRASRIGADFLKGIAADAPAATPARAAAPAISASAMAGIQQAIRRQVQPCADRQVNPGPGASRIKVKLHLTLNRSGRLTSPPQVVGTSGVDDDNGRYEERVKDLAVSIISGCAPLTGLPQNLYQTANGGWSNFNMTYSLP